MPRQKQCLPIRLNVASSEAISWNMLDGACANGSSIQLEECRNDIANGCSVVTQEAANFLPMHEVNCSEVFDENSQCYENFVVKHCFCLKINIVNMRDAPVGFVLLGKFTIHVQEMNTSEEKLSSILKTQLSAVYLYVNNESDCESFLHVKVQNRNIWCPVSLKCPVALLKLFHKQQSFRLIMVDTTFSSNSADNNSAVELEISIMATKLAFADICFGQEFVQAKKCHTVMQEVMKYFFDIIPLCKYVMCILNFICIANFCVFDKPRVFVNCNVTFEE